MSDIAERLRRRGETLDALSDPDLPPATLGTLAWKVEARLCMRGAAKCLNEAADEITTLRAAIAEARNEALESAAKRVAQVFYPTADDAAERAAAAIRSLKEGQP